MLIMMMTMMIVMNGWVIIRVPFGHFTVIKKTVRDSKSYSSIQLLLPLLILVFY